MKTQDREDLKLKKINDIIGEVKWMMLTDQMPLDKVKCFSDLHDYCDANVIGDCEELFDPKYGLKEDGHNHTEIVDLLEEIQNAVDAYIKSVTFEMWTKRILAKKKETVTKEG